MQTCHTRIRATVTCILVVFAIASPTAFSQDRATQVLTGIDVLQRDDFRQLAGRRVGLITNHTGINRDWSNTVQLLHEAKSVKLVALFSPEHGFEGKLDVAKISDSSDTQTGIKVYSLYGKTRKPTDEMMMGIDTFVFDIQDIGTRFYTYISTMGNAMQAAAEQDIRFVVLDRPNPINGVDVQGPVLDVGSESFVGFHPISVRHGMTTGELARMFNAELAMKLDLQVIQIEGWNRADFLDATGLPWINPSPNMRCLTQALLYPGIGLLETTNISVGRGTDTPFEVVGAPYIDGVQLARELNAAQLPGIRFVPIQFTPDTREFEGELCGGVDIAITNRAAVDPLRTGLEFARVLRKLYPTQWKTKSLNRLLAHQQTFESLVAGKETAAIQSEYEDGLEQFKQRRGKYLLYAE
jgi:uncharacterized protein YbbC (DUF1343 family)